MRRRGWIALLSVGALVLMCGLSCHLFGHRDATPPLAAMVAPLDSAILRGTITLQADVADSSGILSVVFLVDGDSVGPGVEGMDYYECVWNSTLPAANTWHTIQARGKPGDVTRINGRIEEGAGRTQKSKVKRQRSERRVERKR